MPRFSKHTLWAALSVSTLTACPAPRPETQQLLLEYLPGTQSLCAGISLENPSANLGRLYRVVLAGQTPQPIGLFQQGALTLSQPGVYSTERDSKDDSPLEVSFVARCLPGGAAVTYRTGVQNDAGKTLRQINVLEDAGVPNKLRFEAVYF